MCCELSYWCRRILAALCATVLVAATGCESPSEPVESPADRRLETDAPLAGGALPTRPRIVALGDSLTAGLGLSLDHAYPALLQQRLNEAGLNYEVINAGVSGDTSADGLSRLEWNLDGDVRVLIVALGGNDGLRGLPPEQLQRNLSEIIVRAQVRGIAVVLAGMEAPPNFGATYTTAFRQVFPELAKKYDVRLVPFLLEGVAGVEALNQRDLTHPTAEGARKVADHIWGELQPIVEER